MIIFSARSQAKENNMDNKSLEQRYQFKVIGYIVVEGEGSIEIYIRYTYGDVEQHSKLERICQAYLDTPINDSRTLAVACRYEAVLLRMSQVKYNFIRSVPALETLKEAYDFALSLVTITGHKLDIITNELN
jgi:hypothetical protein